MRDNSRDHRLCKGVRFPTAEGILSRRCEVQTRSETKPAYCPTVTGDSPGRKWPDREANHSPASVMMSRIS